MQIVCYTVTETVVIPIKLENCGEYCPLSDFAKQLENVLPVDEAKLCQRQPDKENNNSAVQLSSSFICFILTFYFLLFNT